MNQFTADTFRNYSLQATPDNQRIPQNQRNNCTEFVTHTIKVYFEVKSKYKIEQFASAYQSQLTAMFCFSCPLQEYNILLKYYKINV
jgi:hexokinase